MKGAELMKKKFNKFKREFYCAINKVITVLDYLVKKDKEHEARIAELEKHLKASQDNSQ